MSVIVGRALPDVRDGLKPVHRRVLFTMNGLNNTHNRPYMKSARVVGDVMGKYHPHGDVAIYDTVVRMAQTFAMRYLLVDGQGNFGSVDGDPPAAMRYTEVRMARLASELLADLDKETVPFGPNYDDTLTMPEVLPTRAPNLLINGSSGIAVGMATNIPPHNLREVVDGLLALMDDPLIGIDGLMEHIQGPDFPTAGIINGRAGIVEAYRTGRGRIYVRARAEVLRNDKTDRETIVVTEIPYQLNKSRLIEKIAELVKEKRIEGITELRDESDKDGLRIVIELRRGEAGDVVLNNLYAQTQLQSVYGINCVALVDGQPRVLNLKQMLEAFLQHRKEVVTRRSLYLLRRARQRGHLLEGQAVALANIEEVIELIRRSRSAAEARTALMGRGWHSRNVEALLERAGAQACRPEGLGEEFGLRDGAYHLSQEQAQAILDLRLHRLTALEQDKLIEDYQGVLDEIAELQEILGDKERLAEVVREEFRALAGTYGDERRTEDPRQPGGFDHRGPHHRGGPSGDHLPPRLRQDPALARLPGATARRARQVGGQRTGGGFRGAPADRQQPRHPAVLLQPRQGLLAAGIPHPARQPQRQGPAPCQPAAVGTGRAPHLLSAGEQLRRRPLRVHGHRRRHGEEDRAFAVLPPPPKRPDRLGPDGGQHLGRRRHHGWKAGHTADRQFRQGGPLQGFRRAGNGAQRQGSARHPLSPRPAGDLLGHPGRERVAAHRQRPGLRQAHLAQRIPG